MHSFTKKHAASHNAGKITFLTLIFLLALFPAASETITFSTDSMSGSIKQNGSTTILTGNAKVTTESMEISADRIELSGEDYRIITATGNVKGSSSESGFDFTCQRMTYDRETKIATLEDTVHLIDEEHSVAADAEMMEYDQNTSTAIMQINVKLTQENNVCTAAYAIYHKVQQMLELSGNPNVKQGSDSFRAQQISLNLETQQITLDGRVKGSVSSSTSGDKK